MKTDKQPAPNDDLRPECDFHGGERGKYAKRYRDGSNIVVLDPDVPAEFKSSREVNQALRTYLTPSSTRWEF
jgi:hypothetical protein